MLGTILTACSSEILTGPKNQVVLTLWHNYGGQLKDTMDEMIDKFNETVGAKGRHHNKRNIHIGQ